MNSQQAMDFDRMDDDDDRCDVGGDDYSGSGDESELLEFMCILSRGSTDDGSSMADSSPPTQDQLDILGLECHFNWIQSALGHLRPHDLVRIRKRNESWIEDTKDDSLMVYYKKLTQNIIRALCAYLKGLYDEALEILKKALRDMRIADAQEGGFEQSHFLAYEWIINANRLVLLYKLGEMGTPDAVALKKTVLEQDCGYAPTAAMFRVIKVCHLRWFEVDGAAHTQELLEQALELDPDVPAYMIEIFGFLRHIRRDEDFLSGPTKREESLIFRALELAPDSPIVLRHLGTFYQDALKSHLSFQQGECKIVEEIGVERLVKEMISRAKEAADMNPESVGTSIRYAEVLTYGKSGRKDSTANWKEAQDQFSYCLEKWPKNSEVLHKIGKLAIHMDFPTGIDYFKRSLESNPENFPCLMDFIRYSYRKDKERSVPELIGYLDLHADTLVLRPVLLKKLQLLKGSLLVRENKLEEAVECWIEGLGQPQSAEEIAKDAVSVMLGTRMLDYHDRIRQVPSLIRYLEREIQNVEESSHLRSLVAITEVFTVYKKKLEKKLSPCDADSSWRTSAAPVGTATPQALNGHGVKYVADVSILGPYRPPSDFGNWRASSTFVDTNGGAHVLWQKPWSAVGSTNGDVTRCSSGFGSGGSDWSGNGHRVPRERNNSTSSDKWPNVNEWETNGKGGQSRFDRRAQEGGGGGGRTRTVSVSDADDNWRRKN